MAWMRMPRNPHTPHPAASVRAGDAGDEDVAPPLATCRCTGAARGRTLDTTDVIGRGNADAPAKAMTTSATRARLMPLASSAADSILAPVGSAQVLLLTARGGVEP
jgi:hypothetical protein